jgi:hypothetical protein
MAIDETDPQHGLTMSPLHGTRPFIPMPQAQSLSIQGDGHHMTKLHIALNACETLNKSPLIRSNGRRIFCDYGKSVMYTCAGVQVSRNSREVLDAGPWMKELPLCHWKVWTKLMWRVECCFEEISDLQVLSHLYHAKKIVLFKTMSMPSSDKVPGLKYYGGMAFGCNAFLRCHTDHDFTRSIVQVHLRENDKYEIKDDIVVYFCLPTLGVAIPLRPGDCLLFNALIPHCISSCCEESDDIYIVSMYLKSLVVGLNDNQLPLNTKQSILAKLYCEISTKELKSKKCQVHLCSQ